MGLQLCAKVTMVSKVDEIGVECGGVFIRRNGGSPPAPQSNGTIIRHLFHVSSRSSRQGSNAKLFESRQYIRSEKR